MFCTVIVNSKKFNKTASVNCELMLLQKNSPDPHGVEFTYKRNSHLFHASKTRFPLRTNILHDYSLINV